MVILVIAVSLAFLLWAANIIIWRASEKRFQNFLHALQAVKPPAEDYVPLFAGVEKAVTQAHEVIASARRERLSSEQFLENLRVWKKEREEHQIRPPQNRPEKEEYSSSIADVLGRVTRYEGSIEVSENPYKGILDIKVVSREPSDVEQISQRGLSQILQNKLN